MPAAILFFPSQISTEMNCSLSQLMQSFLDFPEEIGRTFHKVSNMPGLQELSALANSSTGYLAYS